MERVFQISFEPSPYRNTGHRGGTFGVRKSNHYRRGTPIFAVKPGKAPDCDEIRPEMLNVLNQEDVLCLSRVCQMAWCSGRAPKYWQTGLIIPMHKK